MNRREIKNRIAFKFRTAVPRVEKYKIGAAVGILETIRFILFRPNLFRIERSVKYATVHLRMATNIRNWSLAYSFIYSN